MFARNIFPEVVEEGNSDQNNNPFLPPPPLKLGAPGGPEIDNKSTILSEIDQLLGVNKPPAIEFIFVEPYLYYYCFILFVLLFAIINYSIT